jgi:hypothetical protein
MKFHLVHVATDATVWYMGEPCQYDTEDEAQRALRNRTECAEGTRMGITIEERPEIPRLTYTPTPMHLRES